MSDAMRFTRGEIKRDIKPKLDHAIRRGDYERFKEILTLADPSADEPGPTCTVLLRRGFGGPSRSVERMGSDRLDEPLSLLTGKRFQVLRERKTTRAYCRQWVSLAHVEASLSCQMAA